MQVAHADDLVHQLNILFYNAPVLEKMGNAGLQFVSDNQGATKQALTLISLAFNQALYNEMVSSQVKSTF
jgi:3-deoxy-D-manno-octulosonic-acid transferase